MLEKIESSVPNIRTELNARDFQECNLNKVQKQILSFVMCPIKY